MKLNQNKLLLLSFVSINKSIQTEAMLDNILSAVTEKIKENVTPIILTIGVVGTGWASYMTFRYLKDIFVKFQEEMREQLARQEKTIQRLIKITKENSRKSRRK